MEATNSRQVDMEDPVEQQWRREDEEPEIDVKRFLYKYLGYWYLFVISIAGSLVAAYYYNWYVTPIYRAECTILIKDKNYSADTDYLLEELNVFKRSRNLENDIAILNSRSLISRTIKELEFNVSYYLEGNVKTSERYKESPIIAVYDSLNYIAHSVSLKIAIIDENQFKLTYNQGEEIVKTYGFGDKITNSLGSFSIIKRGSFNSALFNNPAYEKRNLKIQFRRPDNLIEHYITALDIEIAREGSSVLRLTMDDPVPEKGIDFLNKLIEVYIDSDVEQKNRLASNSLKFIDEQLDTTTKDLIDLESSIEKFKTDRRITDISSEAASFLNKAEIFDAQISEIDIQLSFLTYLEKYLKENQNLATAPTSMGINDPLLQNLIKRLSELENEYEKYSQITEPDNPLIGSLYTQIRNTKKAILENVASIKNGLIASRNEADQQLTVIESKIRTIPQAERKLIGIKRRFTIKESLYLYLLERRSETAILLASTVSDNRVIDMARASSDPIRPEKDKSYLVALVFGLALPVVFLYIRAFANDKIIDRLELEELTSIPILGAIGVNYTENMIVVADNAKSRITEQFRSIRTNLQYLNTKKGTNVILVTSIVNFEGKSFCSGNLAVILALSGKKTLLMGLDLRKPSISDEFDLKVDKGITEYLVGEVELPEIIQSSGINDNLDVIISGTAPPNPVELMLSEEMEGLMDDLKKAYDYIIFDSPPVGLVTDALVLTKYSNTNIFIVRQRVTRKQFIKSINQFYKEGKIKNMSLILNAAKAGMEGYGGYGYRYGYSYYSDDDQKPGFIHKIRRVFTRKSKPKEQQSSKV